MISKGSNNPIVTQFSPHKELQDINQPFLIISKNGNSKPRANVSPQPRANSPYGQQQIASLKRAPGMNSREFETAKKRSVSAARSNTKMIADQRIKIVNQTSGIPNPIRKNREIPTKRSISAQRQDVRSRNSSNSRLLVDEDDEEALRGRVSRDSFSRLSGSGGKSYTNESEEFPKIERPSSRSKKQLADPLPQHYLANKEKLPSLEEKKKRVSALQDFMNTNYGAGKIDVQTTSFQGGVQQKRSESRDRGGNIRKRMYASRNSNNTSVVSDALNISMQKDNSLLDNTELMEGDMNPEEVHCFFVNNIQKSKRLLLQVEK